MTPPVADAKTATDPVVVVRDATIAYGQAVAVEGVSFTIRRGEYVCLIGRNGCGKSSLIKGILGLVPVRSGEIVLPGGPDSTAYLPQVLAAADDFPATVWEVVLSGCQRAHWSWRYTKEDKATALRALEAMHIGDLAGRRMSDLSGGQRQRALLARCLCREPSLLLLDEPYTGLDPQATRDLTQLLLRLQEKHGIAILMSSHDLTAVAACANRILVLDTHLQFDGNVDDWVDRFKSCRLKT